MSVVLNSNRATLNLEKETSPIRVALSWCRDGEWGISGRVKQLRGMNLDLVVSSHTSLGTVNGLFLPENSGDCDWLTHSYDEKRGGRAVWDESVVVDLHKSPAPVSMLTFAAAAVKPGTSFNAIPRVTVDVYDMESVHLAQSVTLLPDGLSDEPDETVNLASVIKLVRAGGFWSLVLSRSLHRFDTGDAVKLAMAMEETV